MHRLVKAWPASIPLARGRLAADSVVCIYPAGWCWGIRLCLALVLLTLPTRLWAQEPHATPSDVPDRAWAIAGAAIYAAHCQPCHGMEGQGDGPVMADTEHAMIDFSDPVQLIDRTPAQWVETTRTGRIEALMPPWDNQLTSTEIWDAVTFLWQLATTEDELVRGADLWTALTATVQDRGLPAPDTTAWTHRALTLTPVEWRTMFPEDFALPVDRVLIDAELDALQRYLQSQVLVPHWAPSLRSGSTALTGTVIPRSPGQELPPMLPVRLTAATGSTILAERHTALDDQYRFVFRELDPSFRLAYQVEVEVENLVFTSPDMFLATDEGTQDIQLEVFSPSAVSADLEVGQVHAILSVGSERILVGLSAWLVNTTPYVFTGTEDVAAPYPVTARVPLAPNATELTVAESTANRFTRSGDVLLDSQAIYPAPTGSWVTIGYSLPLSTTTWIQAWDYPLRNVTIRVSERPDVTVRLPGLERTGQAIVDDQPFAVWQAAALPTGQLAVHFDNRPAAAAPLYQMPVWVPWAVAVFLLGLITAAVGVPQLTLRRPAHGKPQP